MVSVITVLSEISPRAPLGRDDKSVISSEDAFVISSEVEKSPSEALAAHLRDTAKVALCPGSWYGEAGEGFLRLNIACPRSTLRDALSRLIPGLRSFR